MTSGHNDGDGYRLDITFEAAEHELRRLCFTQGFLMGFRARESGLPNDEEALFAAIAEAWHEAFGDV
jgi:hypothetical protein